MIRDVSESYRLAIQETVAHFINWRPSIEKIDKLKTEGGWNNDWEASLELIRRQINYQKLSFKVPRKLDLIDVFNNFYFGGEPKGDSKEWKGFIRNEKLLVNQNFFREISKKDFKWGFVSGAEASSIKFILEERLNLIKPPFIAMGDAPDKPSPEGLIKLSRQLVGKELGEGVPPITFIGDTVADVLTIKNARRAIPTQIFFTLAVSPPHLQKKQQINKRIQYEKELKLAGSDYIINSTKETIKYTLKLINRSV